MSPYGRARKGYRRERQARERLQSEGYAVVRAGGSFGLWDLIGIRRIGAEPVFSPDVRLVQVKSNRWPGPEARAALLKDVRSYAGNVRGELWRYSDHAGLEIMTIGSRERSVLRPDQTRKPE